MTEATGIGRNSQNIHIVSEKALMLVLNEFVIDSKIAAQQNNAAYIDIKVAIKSDKEITLYFNLYTVVKLTCLCFVRIL